VTELYACDPCLRRTELVRLLAPRIERAGRGRTALGAMLALSDDDLIAALGAREDRDLHVALHQFDADDARARIAARRLAVVCRHGADYPQVLLDLEDAPAVLHIAGDVAALAALCTPERDVPTVAVVGARRATPYGLEAATMLGRGLALAGMSVVSGMALGVDSAAHAGALDGEGRTIAVLAAGADAPYPASKRSLYERILASGCAISEMPPGSPVMRWAFPARNRIIAALASATIVVEARERSGSLITADIAADLGRGVGAVPGPVTGTRSSGTNALLRDGAAVIRDARDALDLVASPETPIRRRPAADQPPSRDRSPVAPRRPALDGELKRALESVEEGADSPERLAAVLGGDVARASVALARLELEGLLRRRHDGTYGLRVTT
jgi:DNA processing protein